MRPPRRLHLPRRVLVSLGLAIGASFAASWVFGDRSTILAACAGWEPCVAQAYEDVRIAPIPSAIAFGAALVAALVVAHHPVSRGESR